MKPANTDSLQAIKIQTLTKADSLSTIKINQLTVKIDSLQKVVAKTEVGQGYFSDILNSQLVIFSVIITVISGLAALISWKWIERKIVKIDKVFSKFEETVIEKIKDIENDNAVNKADIYRAMSLLCHTEKMYGLFVLWQLRGYSIYLNMKKYDWGKDKDLNKSRIAWIKTFLSDIDYSEISKEYFEETQNIFNEARNTKSKKFKFTKKELLDIEEKFNKGYYAYLASKDTTSSLSSS